MNALQRGFLCALAAPALLFGACRARPDLARRVNLDVWALPELKQVIADGRREEAHLDETGRAADERTKVRERIADDVVVGRMGLFEAAARFHELNRDNLAGERGMHDRYPGVSDEELCCRQVLTWVEARLAEAPTAEADPVRVRLAEEMREHFGHDTPHLFQ